MKTKKLKWACICMFICFILDGCTSKETDEKITSSSVSDIVDSSVIDNQLITTLVDYSSTSSDSNPVTDPDDDIDIPKLFMSFSEMINYRDTYYYEHFNTNETNMADRSLYERALAAYDRDLGRATINSISYKDDNSWIESTFATVAYITTDSIPEVLISPGGTTRIEGIHIFTYDIDTDSVVWLGEYGYAGSVMYVEGKNRVISQDGGMGFFTNVYTEFINNKPKYVGALARYSNFGMATYARFPMADGFDGSLHSPTKTGQYDSAFRNTDVGPYFDLTDVTYVVSEDEFNAVANVLGNFPDEDSIKYLHVQDMDTVCIPPGGIVIDYDK